jgi:hypothetical protein
MTTPTPAQADEKALRRAVTRAMEGAGTLPAKDSVKLCPSDWHLICDLVLRPAPTAALRPEGEAVAPYCWVLPGDDTANADGWIDARVSQEGEFTKPLYEAPPAPAQVEAASLPAPGGVVVDLPAGAIENGRVFAERVEASGFECEAGRLAFSSDWQEFRRCFEHLAEWVLSRASLATDASPSGESAS